MSSNRDEPERDEPERDGSGSEVSNRGETSRERSSTDSPPTAERTSDTDTAPSTQGRSTEANGSVDERSARGPEQGDRRTTRGGKRGAGETAGQALDSASATLLQPGPKGQLMFVVGLFGFAGLGVGIAGFFISSAVGAEASGAAGQVTSGIVSAAATMVVLFFGMFLAAVAGGHVAGDLDGSGNEVYLASFVGNLLGYVLLGVIVGLLFNSTTSGGFGNFLVALLLLGVIAGAVGCGVSVLHRRVIGRTA